MHNVSTMSASPAVRPNSGCGSSAPSSSGNCQSQKGDFNAALRSAMSAYSSKDCHSSKDCKPSKEDEPKTEEPKTDKPQEETNVSAETPPAAEAPTSPATPSQPGSQPSSPPNKISVVERQVVFHRVIVPVRASVVHVVPIHHIAPYRLIVPNHHFFHGPQRFGRNDPELDSFAMQLAKEMGIGGGKDSRNSLKKFFDALQELLDKGMISRNDVIDFVKHPQKMHKFRDRSHAEFASALELYEKLWGKEGKAEKGEKDEKGENAEKSEKAENVA
jgi:hypothetical protein